MDTAIAAVVTIAVAVVGASVVYQVVTNPQGTAPVTQAGTKVIDTVDNNLFK